MSIEAMTWALKVPVGGNMKIVLLGLANHAHPDGSESYPALETLAEYAHCDRSTARRNVRKLVAEGWAIEEGQGPKGQTRYRLPLGGGKMPPREQGGGGISAPGGVAPVPPEPSIEPSISLERASAAVKKVTYNGKIVPSLIVRGAEELLRNFNEATGRSLGARTSDGGASPALRQIVGAMLARPEVRPDSWAEGIRMTVQNPPAWMAGQTVQIGHVFGERAAEWALSNNGKVAARAAKDPAKQERVDRFMDVLQRYAA